MSHITTIYADKDNWIYESSPTAQYGAGGNLKIGIGGVFKKLTGIFEFDVSAITKPSDVVSAIFSLTESSSFSGQNTMTLARLSQDFTESTSNWNTYDGSSAWASAGAEGDAELTEQTYTFTVGGGGNDVSVDIKELVIDAINNRSGVLRFICFYNGTPSSNGYSVFNSRTNLSGNYPNIVVTIGASTLPVTGRFYVPNLQSLDILGGYDLLGNNTVLRANQTKILGRGTYDYCQTMRDAIVSNRGYITPPYYKTDWRFGEEETWTPSEFVNLETWFSPEDFHPNASNDTNCDKLENRSETSYSSTNAVQTALLSMPRFTTSSTSNRGLSVLDFAAKGYELESTSDWEVGTENWCCVILLRKPFLDRNDEQTIIKKGSRFNLYHDKTGTNNDVVFSYGDGTNTGSLTTSDHSATGTTLKAPVIYSFGRTSNQMFLRALSENSDNEETTTRFTGNMSETIKTRIGWSTTLGSSASYHGGFIELIFLPDNGVTSDEATMDNVYKIEGYLAHKYKINESTLPPNHLYYANGPLVT